MTAKRLKRPYTRADFLAWEAEQEERWEFIDGLIRMMAGGTVAHNTIAGNIFAHLHAALRGGPVRPFQQNMKLAPTVNEDVTYPDVFVLCRPVAEADPTVASATVIVEVVSKTSREDDYERKFQSYEEIPELRHYLVVEQDRAHVSVYSRSSPEEDWRLRNLRKLDESVELPSIGVTLSLRQVYEGTRIAA
jgi:Uma2 family endonuclease